MTKHLSVFKLPKNDLQAIFGRDCSTYGLVRSKTVYDARKVVRSLPAVILRWNGSEWRQEQQEIPPTRSIRVGMRERYYAEAE